ncbi:hypothetical protein [Ferrovibrio sp.]|uniref:helix-turn-helix transcriptional regulator n=1 Tax=Ferrovibrio sp. TaxID=1917215 RepID=UPI0025C5FAB4|nr:hypothetical protein [Ferrovibrio sp.]MBX3455918.1 hypothetical protein [Ferrovibrio sp.]
MDIVQFSALVESLYEAAVAPMGWQGISTRIATAFNAGSCALQIRDTAAPQTAITSFTDNYDAKSLSDYENYFHARDPYVEAGLKAGIGIPLLSHEVITERDFLKSELYYDFGKRIGVCHLVGAMLPINASSIGGIGIHRAHDRPVFSPEDKQNFGLLLPHLIRALQMHHRLNGIDRQRQIGFEALEALGIGVVAVNEFGKVLFANRVASALLQTGQGITISQGHLRAEIAARNPPLQKAMQDAGRMRRGTSISAGGLIALPRRMGEPLSLLICPAPADALGGDLDGTTAIIFVNNPDSERSPSHAALMSQFGLTPAEAKLAAGLLDGDQLEEYASRSGVSLHTVKTQLKQVFAKTGCTRQAEFIRLALSNPVLRLCRSY